MDFLDEIDPVLNADSRNRSYSFVLYNYWKSKLTGTGNSLKFRKLLQRRL